MFKYYRYENSVNDKNKCSSYARVGKSKTV